MDLYGAIGVKAVVSRHLLVRLACGISSSRPDFRGAAARSAVNGGRRPSRSDLPLTVASTASDFRVGATGRVVFSLVQCRLRRRYRGELAIG
jgi:hypothetical protein